jgi:hypothetical protein
MIWHHNPGVKPVSHSIEVQECVFDQAADSSITKPGRSQPLVQEFFDTYPLLGASTARRQKAKLVTPTFAYGVGQRVCKAESD